MAFSSEVSININKLVDGDLDKILQTALERACLIVEADARERCPVDTGQLQASITSEVDGLTGSVGTNVEYAPYVELGTSKMSAQPFLLPSLEANRSKIERCFEKLL